MKERMEVHYQEYKEEKENSSMRKGRKNMNGTRKEKAEIAKSMAENGIDIHDIAKKINCSLPWTYKAIYGPDLTPEQVEIYREYEKEYRIEYRQQPDVKARAKERKKEYYQRPEVKVRQKEYYQRPEVKTKMKEYNKEYYQRKKETML